MRIFAIFFKIPILNNKGKKGGIYEDF